MYELLKKQKSSDLTLFSGAVTRESCFHRQPPTLKGCFVVCVFDNTENPLFCYFPSTIVAAFSLLRVAGPVSEMLCPLVVAYHEKCGVPPGAMLSACFSHSGP